MNKSKPNSLAANNNGGTIRKLAISSVKSSGLRNFFVIITIALSVSLLMVTSLFYTGMNTENVRKVAEMQHVIYRDLSQEQLEQLAKDTRTEYVLGMKTGKGIEIDNKLISPVAYGSKPLKAEGIQISTVSPVAGTEPVAINEVMLSDAHCKALGIKVEPGQNVSFTFLDGTTEEFIISGIFHMKETSPIYNFILSAEYAEQGAQLRDLPYEGIVRIHGAPDMEQEVFLEKIRSMASDYGIERKNVNENNYFLNTLSGGEKQQMEMIVILCVGAGILFASILVIYSVFYLAVSGRIQQFGQLRTIGMTRKQIGKMVQVEGLILCGIGTPIGLLIGGTASYFIRPDGWSWINTVTIGGCVVIADLITVLVSVNKPAKIAASVTPVEASKCAGVEVKTTKSANTSKKLTVYKEISPLRLAVISWRRNQKKACMTLLSLGVGGVLFMTAAVFMNSLNLEEYSRQGEYSFGEFIISLSYNVAEAAEHGQTSMQINNPLNQEFMHKIEEIDGVEKIFEQRDSEVVWSAKGETQETDSMSSFKQEDVQNINTMLVSGSIDYEKMMEKNQILVQASNGRKELYGWGFEIGDQVNLSWYDGERQQEKSFTIAGTVDLVQYTKEYFFFGTFILPEEMLNEMVNGINLNTSLIVKVDRLKEDKIEAELNTLMKEQPMLNMYTLKAQEAENESSFNLLFSIILGLSLFIVAFSVLNMINTLVTNILTRRREFAMLQSVGMTRNQLFCMLQAEGIMLIAGNLIITALLGSAAGYGIVYGIQSLGVDYMHFHFPVLMYGAYAIFTIIVPVIVSTVMIHGFRKESLVSRLR